MVSTRPRGGQERHEVTIIHGGRREGIADEQLTGFSSIDITTDVVPALDYDHGTQSHGSSLADLGFSPELCVWSYRNGHAKPGTFVFDKVKEALASRDVSSREVFYIGNDLLNDVTPARAVGFRTALFAGDRRSLRLREGDRRNV